MSVVSTIRGVLALPPRAVLVPLSLLVSLAYGLSSGGEPTPPRHAVDPVAAPVVTIAPASGSTYSGSTSTHALPVVIGVCTEGEFTGSSPKTITLNAVNVTSSFLLQTPTDPDAYLDCNVGMEIVGTVALTSGSNTLNVSVTDGSGTGTATASYTYSYTPATYTVGVTPDGGSVSYDTTTTQRTATFTVSNSGNAAATYTLSPTCSGVLTSCGIGSGTVTVGAGSNASVGVSFVARTPGTGRVRLLASYGGVTADSGWVTVTATVPPGTLVSVTPDGTAVSHTAGAGSHSRTFTVQNLGASPASYTLSALCSGTATSCSVSSPLAVPAGGSQTVNVTYQAGTAGPGRVRLRAQAGGAASDSGWVVLDVAPASGTPQAAGVAVADPNPGVSISRSMCLTVAISGDAAAECGDLRLAHGLPGIMTMNKARAMTLLYNSQHAHPTPTVAANVTLPATATRPDSVTAKLFLNTESQPAATGKWSGTDWGYGTARRIALSFDALTRATGKYDFRIEVRNHYGAGSQMTQATGRLVVVNRSATPYRPGWWPAGVEELKVLGSDTLLWIGGDGSTRLYARAPGATVFRAENVTRPDTVTLPAPGGNYTRWLPGGVRVVFDFAGRHVQTVGRRGTTTTFSYPNAGARRLYRITLPVPSGTAPYYEFSYASSPTDTLLSSITAPPAGSLTRVTQVRWDAGARRLTFVEPDTMAKLHFDHDATLVRRIVKRTDRNGDVTEYTFRTGGTVATGRRYMSGTTAAAGDLITTLVAVESRGLPGAAAVDTSRAYSHVDGARTDLTGDSVVFRLDRFGAPRQVVDALGRATTLVRGHPTFPALVTRSETPADTTLAFFDTLGRIDSTTVPNPLGDGQHATTRYRYDATWKDFVARVVPPLGDSTVIAYDANGDRTWQQPGADATRRATFAYNTWGQVVATQTPRQAAAGKRDSIFYDALGNVRSTRSALGFRSLVLRDAIGRDTLSFVPVDSLTARDTVTLKNDGVKTYTRYDTLGRVTETRTSGRARGYPSINIWGEEWAADSVPALQLTVQNRYDREGRLLRVERWSTPDTAHLGHLVTKWAYDRAGRQTEERGPDTTLVTTRAYNAAGMDTAVTTRRGLTVRKGYDVAGRLTMSLTPAATYAQTSVSSNIPARATWYYPYRTPNADGTFTLPNTVGSGTFTIPGDTVVFGYDPLTDALLSADNRSARVRRTYYPSGALRSDTTVVYPSDGRTTTDHVYGIRYEYDRNGRRTRMHAPSQLVQGASWMATTRYQYDAVTGALSRLDSGSDTASYRYTFTYDVDGQLDSISYLKNDRVTESYDYDLDGQLLVQQRRRGGVILHADTFTYDGAGRRARIRSMADSVTNVYGPLGALMWSHADRYNGQSETVEFILGDAMANTVSARTISLNTSPTGSDLSESGVNRYTYETGGRLRISQDWDARETTGGVRDSTAYDASGNKSLFVTARSVAYTGLQGGGGVLKEVTRLYYGADEKLRVVDRRSCVDGVSATNGTRDCWNPPYNDRPTFEEYRYDGLGRRVMTLTDQTWSCATSCATAETRTVWDGDQIIAEVRSPWGSQQDSGPMDEGATLYPRQMGRVLYTHGLNLDKPLLLARIDYDSFFPGTNAIIPHTNWQGNYDSGTFVTQLNGTGPACVSRPRNPQDAQSFPSDDPDVTTGSGMDSITICYRVEWPAEYMHVSKKYRSRGRFGSPSWMGSLIEGGRDPSGQIYMRNRFYDATTGRFTQEDPIGLAGGINLYGYAGGDPVNFSDPYGLCAQTSDTIRIAVSVDCGDGTTGLREVEAVTVSDPATIALLVRALGRLEGGDESYSADDVVTQLHLAVSQGQVYQHGVQSDDGLSVLHLGGAWAGGVSFRSDVLENVRQGRLHQRVGGRTTCSVLGHEGVHLVQFSVGRMVGDPRNESEAASTNPLWRCP